MRVVKGHQGINVEIKQLPFILRFFTLGFMWRGKIYFINPIKIPNRTLSHELIHVEQWKTNKNFYIKYFLIWLKLALTFKRAYTRHPMELEARIAGSTYQGWKLVSKGSYKMFWKYVNSTDIEISALIEEFRGH